DRRRGQARVHAHPPGARAAHPPREGVVQHLHEPGAHGAPRDDLPRDARAGRPPPRGRDLRPAVPRARGEDREDPGREDPLLVSVLPRVHRGDPPPGPDAGEAPGARVPRRAQPPAALPRPARPRSPVLHRTEHGRRHRRVRLGPRRVDPMKTIFEKSKAGRGTAYFPAAGPNEKPATAYLPEKALRQAPLQLPEISELEIVRHFTELSHRTFSIDGNFYPLGSCTMKYNPKINEKIAAMAG